MRGLILVALGLLAGCSDSGGEEKVAQAADSLQAGQWDVRFELKDFRSTDKPTTVPKSAAADDKPAPGDKTSATSCIEAGKENEPPAAMFAAGDYECQYKDRYFSGGRLNLSLECGRDALQGKVMLNVQGSHTGDRFDVTTTATSFLPGEGDFVMNSKVTGRRTGPSCAAPVAEGEKGRTGA